MINEIAVVLTSLKTSLDISKELRALDEQMLNSETKLKIIELTDALVEARLATINVKEDMTRKEDEIRKLKDTIRLVEGGTVEFNDFLYRIGDDGQPKGRPFCPRCLKVDGTMIQLVEDSNRSHHFSYCPHCKNPYGRDAKKKYVKAVTT